MSPSLRGRGLKYLAQNKKMLLSKRRPLYEGVDWNTLMGTCFTQITCRPLYEGVDWNSRITTVTIFDACRPLYEGVDWNINFFRSTYANVESPSLRGRGLKSCTALTVNHNEYVALFTRAWIEISRCSPPNRQLPVALFTRAWIEIALPFTNG